MGRGKILQAGGEGGQQDAGQYMVRTICLLAIPVFGNRWEFLARRSAEEGEEERPHRRPSRAAVRRPYAYARWESSRLWVRFEADRLLIEPDYPPLSLWISPLLF